MSRRFVSPRAVTLAIILGGCAGSMGTIRSDPPPLPPITSFDGSYRTTIQSTPTRATENTIWCSTSGQSVVVVANGQFGYAVPHPNVPGNPTPAFPATFAADGMFSGQIIAGMIFGQVQGSHMEGRIDGSGCLYTFTGERI
jgi:hypothetical protein